MSVLNEDPMGSSSFMMCPFVSFGTRFMLASWQWAHFGMVIFGLDKIVLEFSSSFPSFAHCLMLLMLVCPRR